MWRCKLLLMLCLSFLRIEAREKELVRIWDVVGAELLELDVLVVDAGG